MKEKNRTVMAPGWAGLEGGQWVNLGGGSRGALTHVVVLEVGAGDTWVKAGLPAS